MGKNLVIVESPGKIKKLQEVLGNDYIVKASIGHIRDLEKKDETKLCAFARGRLPVMVLESCIVKANGKCRGDCSKACGVLKDRIGKEFMIFGEKRLNEKTSYKPCRNIVVNSVEADILSSDEKISKMNVDTGIIYVWE